MRHVCLLLLLSGACGPVPDVDSIEVDPTTAGLQAGPSAYLDVEESFTNEEDQNRWFELKRRLRQDFDDICGDTFCEGDFTNLQAMSFRCSVATRGGQLKSCLWLFAGSHEAVTPSTGNIRPTARFFQCKIPVQGTPVALLDALLQPGGDGPLWLPMPGSTQSIYDSLLNCL